jgi:hypothetical protein
MDLAVLNAYGWNDISTECTFLLDYEEEEDEDTSTNSHRSGRGKKKPWRYRWSENIHDEVLARLLDLNQKRAEAESLSGKLAEGKQKGKTPKKRTPKTDKATNSTLNIPGLE